MTNSIIHEINTYKISGNLQNTNNSGLEGLNDEFLPELNKK
jgi:hypothetical protein